MKVQETQNQKNKKKKLSKFDAPVVNDFIGDKNRQQFKHICNQCRNKFWCEKCKGAIILTCKDYIHKEYKHNNKYPKK